MITTVDFGLVISLLALHKFQLNPAKKKGLLLCGKFCPTRKVDFTVHTKLTGRRSSILENFRGWTFKGFK